jgi:hypothetical protein
LFEWRLTYQYGTAYYLVRPTVLLINRGSIMDHQRMKQLIEQHIAAEMAGDTAGAVSVYTDDVEHDVIGSPTGPLHGPAAAQGFYDHLTADLDTERMTPTREQYGEDFCVVEHEATCVVKGTFMGIRRVRPNSGTSAARGACVARPAGKRRSLEGGRRETSCSPLAQPAPPAAPICMSGRSESPALPRKEEPVLARFQQTPTAAPDEDREPRGRGASRWLCQLGGVPASAIATAGAATIVQLDDGRAVGIARKRRRASAREPKRLYSDTTRMKRCYCRRR